VLLKKGRMNGWQLEQTFPSRSPKRPDVSRPGSDVWRVPVAAVATFVASAAWYIVFSKQRRALSPAAAASTGRPQPTQIGVELARNLVVALLLARLVRNSNMTTPSRAAGLGLLLWIGVPVNLLSGSVMYENVPPQLAAIHAGDWLIKLLLTTVIIGAERR
jgi:hypothetical protein